ncbi:hypothetical protein Hdeb2414_s0010g00328951 [Helianthus debilis subsp. tardiflorus]
MGVSKEACLSFDRFDLFNCELVFSSSALPTSLVLLHLYPYQTRICIKLVSNKSNPEIKASVHEEEFYRETTPLFGVNHRGAQNQFLGPKRFGWRWQLEKEQLGSKMGIKFEGCYWNIWSLTDVWYKLEGLCVKLKMA